MSSIKDCDAVRGLIQPWVDGYLAQGEAQQLELHMLHCTVCAQRAQEFKLLKSTLKQIPCETLDNRFTERAIRQAAMFSPHRPFGENRWAIGLAASVLLVLGLFGFFNLSSTPSAMPSVQLAVHETRTVNLVFDVPNAMDGVEVGLILPNDIELQGYPGQRQLQWHTTLKSGQNLLPLPVRAVSSGSGVLLAELRTKKSTRIFRVHIESYGDVEQSSTRIRL